MWIDNSAEILCEISDISIKPHFRFKSFIDSAHPPKSRRL